MKWKVYMEVKVVPGIGSHVEPEPRNGLVSRW